MYTTGQNDLHDLYEAVHPFVEMRDEAADNEVGPFFGERHCLGSILRQRTRIQPAIDAVQRIVDESREGWRTGSGVDYVPSDAVERGPRPVDEDLMRAADQEIDRATRFDCGGIGNQFVVIRRAGTVVRIAVERRGQISAPLAERHGRLRERAVHRRMIVLVPWRRAYATPQRRGRRHCGRPKTNFPYEFASLHQITPIAGGTSPGEDRALTCERPFCHPLL